MSQINEGLQGYKVNTGATFPVPVYSRVKLDASSSPRTISVAGPYDEDLGILEAAVQASGDFGTVRHRNFPGTRKVICASTCSVGQRLYATTAGQVDTQGSGDVGTNGAAIGKALGYALEASGSAGGVVEMAPIATISPAGLYFSAQGDSASVSPGSTAETAYLTNQFTFPASFFVVGDVLDLTARVRVTAVNGADTFTTKLYLGTLVLQSVPAFNPVAADEILFQGRFLVTAIGTAGKVQGSGTYFGGTPGTATGRAISLSSSTLDTTVAALVKVTQTYSSASATNASLLRDLVAILHRQ